MVVPKSEPSTPTQTASHAPSLGLGGKLGPSYSACDPARGVAHPQNAIGHTVRLAGVSGLQIAFEGVTPRDVISRRKEALFMGV